MRARAHTHTCMNVFGPKQAHFPREAGLSGDIFVPVLHITDDVMLTNAHLGLRQECKSTGLAESLSISSSIAIGGLLGGSDGKGLRANVSGFFFRNTSTSGMQVDGELTSPWMVLDDYLEIESAAFAVTGVRSFALDGKSHNHRTGKFSTTWRTVVSATMRLFHFRASATIEYPQPPSQPWLSLKMHHLVLRKGIELADLDIELGATSTTFSANLTLSTSKSLGLTTRVHGNFSKSGLSIGAHVPSWQVSYVHACMPMIY